MNTYGIIAIAVLLLVAIEYLGASAAIQTVIFSLAQLVARIADIPTFPETENQELWAFGVRLAYLIALVGILRLILSRRRD